MNTKMRLSVAALCVAATAMPTQAGGGKSVVYEMSPDSSYFEGCFGMCLCAIFYQGAVEGTMTLTPRVISGTVDIYDVTDVLWQVNLFGLPGGPIYAGSGTYTIFKEVVPLQQLELELVTDGLDPVVFDSGLEPIDAKFPLINIQISMGDMSCYDKVFGVVTAPIDSTPPSADLNGDGQVNGLDLALLLGQWGHCPICLSILPCPCAADLNSDAVVNGLDLALLLGQWTR